ncbi:hypothetical protein DUNSADRAFT_6946 [Dunaliella salina]|uniref:Encoded protein n=1 Tax=Dunaliella salina TaxID=3046 RepID=A0ABQ7GMB1_DUNSA|nr:hypothetical protein DUNSADRAFT_6946 [Dunaliella salina]|eukprot:KAF5835720.1 hypothetical protein DUNSADRAFT_6946 [Dunaliella salina]
MVKAEGNEESQVQQGSFHKVVCVCCYPFPLHDFALVLMHQSSSCYTADVRSQDSLHDSLHSLTKSLVWGATARGFAKLLNVKAECPICDLRGGRHIDEHATARVLR